MRAFGIVALILLLSVSRAGAEELGLGFTSSLEYDDNVFNTSEDSTTSKEEDFVFRVGPRVTLTRDRGDFTYRVRYSVLWENFVEESGFDNFDHSLDLRGTWRLGPRTSLTVADRFRLTESVNRRFGFDDEIVADPLIEDTPDFEVDRQELTTNTASLRLVHQFTPRLEGQASLSFRLFRSDRDTSFDSESISGSASISYALDMNDRLGFGAGLTQTSVDGLRGGSSDTRFFRFFGIWSHIFDPNTSFSIQAGPTFVDGDDNDSLFVAAVQGTQAFPSETTESGGIRFIDPSTCPTEDGEPFLADRCDLFPTEFANSSPLATFARNAPVNLVEQFGNEGSSGRVTFFADMSFVKRWESWSTRISFRRTDSTSTGQGGTTILNVFSGQVRWEPAPRWDVSLVGNLSTRTSATEQLQTVIGLDPVEFCLGGLDGDTPQSVRLPGSCPAGTTAVPAAAAVDLRRVETDDTFESRSLSGRLRISRRVGRRGSVFLRLNYLTQERDDLNSDREFDNFRAMIGFRWDLDPLHL